MELIKDRIAHILRAKNLTATQFAEMMQIQPSNVSHLLSGRNKPSLDFLMKLKEKFPEYNFDWIILGKKPITNSEPILFGNENRIDTFEMTHIVENDIDKQQDVKEKSSDIVAVEGDFESRQVKDSSKGLKQIIYVFEDHTFEIYNIR